MLRLILMVIFFTGYVVALTAVDPPGRYILFGIIAFLQVGTAMFRVSRKKPQ